MNIAFITYLAAIFILLLGIGLGILLISRKEYRASRLYQVIVCFTAATMTYCGLFFYFYFRDMIPQVYGVGLPLRLFDYLLFGCLPMLWLFVLGFLSEQPPRQIFRWAVILGLAQVLIGCIATCFMNPYYGFSSQRAGTLFVITGTVITLLNVVVIGFYAMDFIRNSTSSLRKRYAAIESLLFCFWLFCQQIVDSGLYLGRFISAWAAGIPDTTGPVMFLIGLTTFVFVFREDFSPLFYAVSPDAKAGLSSSPESGDNQPSPPTDPFESFAAQHGLTIRELDVLRLVYEGKNNPEIAEELFISRNTVKKHLQNIYEKTGVSSRMELIYMVNLKQHND